MASFQQVARLGGQDSVAGEAEVLDYVRHRARPFIFSASIPPSAAALLQKPRGPGSGALAGVRALAQRHLHARAARGARLRDRRTQSPIVPIVTGDITTTFRLWRALFDEGIFVNAAVPPAVSGHRCLLRTSYMATHQKEHLDRALEAFQRVRHKVGVASS